MTLRDYLSNLFFYTPLVDGDIKGFLTKFIDLRDIRLA